jgi:hypothetical protein
MTTLTIEYLHANCYYAECHYDKCHYLEFRGTTFSTAVNYERKYFHPLAQRTFETLRMDLKIPFQFKNFFINPF